jgi:hypothetical protein
LISSQADLPTSTSTAIPGAVHASLLLLTPAGKSPKRYLLLASHMD